MTHRGKSLFNRITITIPSLSVLLLGLLLIPGVVWGQLPVPASSQFDITGFIQSATLGGSGTGPGGGAHQGGVVTVNGHVIIVPSETIVILPASALTWAELFTLAPAPYAPTQTGMALTDSPAPLTTYEAHVIGNRVGDTYIAGLVWISQQSLNMGAGFINHIDYTTGEIRVGGTIGSATTGTRVRINDPKGRFGRASSPDERFTSDPDNPTIISVTGFPMCIPRVTLDPTVAGNPDDPLCPQSNRPITTPGSPAVYSTNFQMNDPVNSPGIPPDATQQAPLEVGDYVTFAGTLVHDGTNPTAGPMPTGGVTSTYISAHTITSNAAIYTFPGTNPAYATITVSLIGTGGLNVAGATEATTRTRFEGMTTDPSRNIHVYGIDLNASTGATIDRDWGTVGVDSSAAGVLGRWRLRPPCTGTAGKDTCSPPPAGNYLPPTREVRAVVEGAWQPGQTTAYANGIIAGQYHAPIQEYLFAEPAPGAPIPSNDFSTLPFLANGGYTSSNGTLVGVLNPWPSDTPPNNGCTAPTADAGGPYTVAAGANITVTANATGTTPLTYAWAAPAQGTLTPRNAQSATFTAPSVSTQTVVTLQLTVSNCGGSATVSTTVTVNPTSAPTMNHTAPVTVASGASSSFPIGGTDPAGLALTFTVTQSGSPALLNMSIGTTSANTATVFFTAPTLPLGQVTPDVVTLSITAKNSGGATSAPDSTTVTVNPIPDKITTGTVQYRTSTKRFTINVTSSVVSPNVVLKLQPYLTTTGATYNPDPAAGGLGNTFTNNGAGAYVLDLSGAPEPAVPPATPLDVKSNLNGDSGPFALTKVN